MTHNLEEGFSPKINYDTFASSIISSFTFILNDEWFISLYYNMLTTNEYSAFYWVLIISIGNIIFVKLFLAIFLNTYIDYIKKKKILGSHSEIYKSLNNQEEEKILV